MAGYPFFTRVLRALLVLLAVCVASPAFAETTLTVLGIEPVGIAGELAQQLTENLRLRAGSTPGIVPVNGKDLIEMKLVFGCETETPSCMAQAGKSLGADKMIYGAIKKISGKNSGYSAEIHLLDVRTGQIERTVHDRLNRSELTISTVTQVAARWFSSLIDVDAKPSLVVISDPPNAALDVDGIQSGRTPTTLRDLSSGTHTLTLSLNGRQSVSRQVELRAGNSLEIVVPLAPAPHVSPNANASRGTSTAAPILSRAPLPPTVPTEQPVVQPAAPHPGRTAIIIGGTLLGAALVCGIVNIYAYTAYRSLEDDIAAGRRTLTPDTRSDGDGKAALSTAMAITWPVLAIAGGTALGVGIYQARSAKTQRATYVLPTASPQFVGAIAGMRF